MPTSRPPWWPWVLEHLLGPDSSHHAGIKRLFLTAAVYAFARVVDRDKLSVDVEPRALAASLVNRYHQVKRAGLL